MQDALAGDVYVVLGDAAGDGGGRGTGLSFNPLASLIWLGAAIMFAGRAVLSLADRRLPGRWAPSVRACPGRRRRPAGGVDVLQHARVLAVLMFSLAGRASPALAAQPRRGAEGSGAGGARPGSMSGGGLRCLVCQNQSIDDSDARRGAGTCAVLIREHLVDRASRTSRWLRFCGRPLWRVSCC
jgi:hypothetical protein